MLQLVSKPELCLSFVPVVFPPLSVERRSFTSRANAYKTTFGTCLYLLCRLLFCAVVLVTINLQRCIFYAHIVSFSDNLELERVGLLARHLS